MLETLVSSSPYALYGTVAVAAALVLFMLASLIGSKSSSAPPVINTGLPIWGTIQTFKKFGENPVAFILEGYKTYGNCFTLPVFGLYNFTFMLGPDAQFPFYNATDQELSQNEPYKFMTPIFGKGIVFDAPHHVKAQQLKFVAGALRKETLRTYVPEIIRETEAYLDTNWGAEGEIDLMDEMAKLTINTASRCLLGRDVREKFGSNVAALLHQIDEGITPLAVINPYLPIESFRRRDAARAQFATMFSAIIKERKKAQESGAPRANDMLQAFMEAEYKDGKKLTDDNITGMLLGVLFAGQHTSSITTTWLSLQISSRPDLFEKVMAEQQEALGSSSYSSSPKDNSNLNYDTVGKMDLLHLAMKEVLRMYPPLIMLMRKVSIPINVCNKYTVPVGHYVFASPAVSMNLPEGSPDAVFKNPGQFDPYRYTDGRAEDMLKKFSYTAFGGGVHSCLGEQFGFLQVKTIVSILLRRYELTVVSNDGQLPGPNYKAMVVGPDQPLRVRFKLRKASHTPKVPFTPVVAPSLSHTVGGKGAAVAGNGMASLHPVHATIKEAHGKVVMG